ncbi:putative quinol monooxygenase [Myxococcaceae bacterium GXIMD 01537]
MADTLVHVVARLKSKKGNEAEVSRMLRALVEPARRERGCRRYELLQGRDDPSTFVFVEEWDDDATLDAHLSAPLIQDALPPLLPLLVSPPEIVRYQQVR